MTTNHLDEAERLTQESLKIWTDLANRLKLGELSTTEGRELSSLAAIAGNQAQLAWIRHLRSAHPREPEAKEQPPSMAEGPLPEVLPSDDVLLAVGDHAYKRTCEGREHLITGRECDVQEYRAVALFAIAWARDRSTLPAERMELPPIGLLVSTWNGGGLAASHEANLMAIAHVAIKWERARTKEPPASEGASPDGEGASEKRDKLDMACGVCGTAYISRVWLRTGAGFQWCIECGALQTIVDYVGGTWREPANAGRAFERKPGAPIEHYGECPLRANPRLATGNCTCSAWSSECRWRAESAAPNAALCTCQLGRDGFTQYVLNATCPVHAKDA